MKRVILACLSLMPALTACSGWTVQPLPYLSPTFYPTGTPSIFTATPVILAPPITATSTATALTQTPATGTGSVPAPSATYTITFTPPAGTTVSPTVTSTATLPPLAAVQTVILGCNTSFDAVHAMGEVTNAYITLQNTGGLDLTDVCATLRGLDEGRPHPDKTQCVASLPVRTQVILKLTVDTTYQQETRIQVEVSNAAGLLQRVASDSCTDIGLFTPDSGDLGVVIPVP